MFCCLFSLSLFVQSAQSLIAFCALTAQLQPQEISPPPTANLDRSNDKVYENVTGLVKAVIEMSSKIQPAPPEEYVPMVKVTDALKLQNASLSSTAFKFIIVSQWISVFLSQAANIDLKTLKHCKDKCCSVYTLYVTFP